MHTQPTARGRWIRRVFAAALAAIAVADTLAQSTSPDAAVASEEVVTIPEFQVSASRDRDAWFASQAMSGTRTAAPIIELPYQVQVVTQEFLEDFQLIDLTDQMSLFTGYSGVAAQADAAIGGTLGGSTLRGFPQTVVRDGFRRAPPPQIGSTAQVEVIKGPISTLYGDASPGGLVNYVSKRPTASRRASLSLSYGSYDYFRSNLTTSGTLVPQKLYYLATVDHYYRKGAVQYTYARNGSYMGTLLFKPFAGTSIMATYEFVRLVGARAATIPSLVVGTRPSGTNPLNWTGGVVQGIDWRLARMGYSRFGPGERYERDYDGLNVLVEHAYNRNWKHRVGYQGQWKGFQLNYRTNSNVSAETNRMAGVVPNRRLQDIDSPVALQTDLLGRFSTGALQHALLFTADYAEEESYDAQYRLPTAEEALLPDFYRYHDPFNPDWSPIIDYTRLTRRASKGWDKEHSRGGSVSDRVSVGDRLIVMGNLRYDQVKFATDSSATIDRFIYGEADSTTYSAGANYKLAGGALVAFANHSTSFNTNVQVDRNLGTTIPNQEGRGWEAGVKSLSADGRLGATLSLYEIQKRNIGQTNPDFILGNGEPEFLGSGRERSRGVEGDVHWKATSALTVTGGATYLEAHVINSSNAALRGTRKINVPRVLGTLAARYNLDALAKGLSVGAAVRHTGGFVRANATATRRYEEADAKELYSAFVSYGWRSGRLAHTLRLNANNLTDKFYVGPDLNLALGRQINGTYTVAFR